MDKTAFTDGKPGQLVQIPHAPNPSKSDWSFIPDQLPPAWEIHGSLWPLIAEAAGSLGTLDGIGQTIPHPELLLAPLRSREAISSSRIEGTYVTPQQLMLFGLDPEERKAGGGGGVKSDWIEVFNYGESLKVGHNMMQTLPICHRVIREMHLTLMSGSHGQDASPGEYRRLQVQLGHTGRFIPPPAPHVQRLMDDFERFVNNDSLYHPLVRAFIAHYQFEAIHPFQDGNGRIGRALAALMISQWMGHSMPWLYLSAFFDKYKDEYINGLFRVSTHGDWKGWVEFCLRGTVAQAEDSIQRCRGFNQLKREFLNSVDHTSRSYKIINGLFSWPVITIASVKKSQGVCYETAKADVGRLASAGIVNEMDGIYPKSFICQKLMDIAFADSYQANGDEKESPTQPIEEAFMDTLMNTEQEQEQEMPF